MNFYTGELNCIRNSKSFARRCETEHRAEVLAGHFDWSVHHTGMGGVTVDQKFYDPERVSVAEYRVYYILYIYGFLLLTPMATASLAESF